MDSNRLKELLGRYWNGDSTLEEEQQLRDHFSTSDISDELKETGALFKYFEQSKKRSLTDISFDRTIVEKINRPVAPKGRVATIVFNAMKIAAGVAVLMVAIWFVRTEVRQNTPQEVVDTYDDPKMAFEETKKALLMISKSFGSAEKQARKINMFNEAKEEIQKQDKESL
ncbi:MAG: hypothetical protein ABJA70_04545 [Chryseolinea sp.]